mmetsp:Transcript_138286/g.429906  ORF Transcript_138286/g.429906 Transcript_138286/m.429906 type:complete len:587 (+) Transcript_138286:64-1824(+)
MLVKGFPLLLIPLVAFGQDEECAQGDPTCESSAKSLLQTNRKGSHLKLDFKKVNTDVEGILEAAAWVADPWGDCMKDCGEKRFRNVECRSVFDAKPLPAEKCIGEEPANSEDCICGGMELCHTAPASGCPEISGSGNGPAASFEEVGCFSLPTHGGHKAAAGKHRIHDMTCLGRSQKKSCLNGLPFFTYQDHPMTATKCYMFCLSRGMDIFALEKGAMCRCGASMLNKQVWRERMPRAGLAFKPEALTLDDSCPFHVWRYTGLLESDGVPMKYRQLDETDLEYKDSIVTGHIVGEGTEEDGPLPEEASLAIGHGMTPYGDNKKTALGLEQKSRRWLWSKTGFERSCYPSQCASQAPWTGRSSRAPKEVQRKGWDRWKDYVVINYQFSSRLDSARKEVFRSAIQDYAEHTCINFVEGGGGWGTPVVKVGVTNSDSCSASVGKPPWWRSASVNLGWCRTMSNRGNVIHELGHTIGMTHEQRRPDAGRRWKNHGPYLKIMWQNIERSWRGEYTPDGDAYTGSANDGSGDPQKGYAPYDYGSIMSYGPGGSGRSAKMEPTKGHPQMGQRNAFSQGDIQQILDMYQCKRKR